MSYQCSFPVAVCGMKRGIVSRPLQHGFHAPATQAHTRARARKAGAQIPNISSTKARARTAHSTPSACRSASQLSDGMPACPSV